MIVTNIKRLSELAIDKGFVQTGNTYGVKHFEKDGKKIDVCDTCGGGFVRENPCTRDAKTYYRNEARQYLQNA